MQEAVPVPCHRIWFFFFVSVSVALQQSLYKHCQNGDKSLQTFSFFMMIIKSCDFDFWGKKVFHSTWNTNPKPQRVQSDEMPSENYFNYSTIEHAIPIFIQTAKSYFTFEWMKNASEHNWNFPSVAVGGGANTNLDAEKTASIDQFFNLEHPALLATRTVQTSLSIRLKTLLHTCTHLSKYFGIIALACRLPHQIS